MAFSISERPATVKRSLYIGCDSVMVTVPKSPLTLILSPENGGEEIPLSPLAGRGSG
jgi:hypothetical protein